MVHNLLSKTWIFCFNIVDKNTEFMFCLFCVDSARLKRVIYFLCHVVYSIINPLHRLLQMNWKIKKTFKANHHIQKSRGLRGGIWEGLRPSKAPCKNYCKRIKCCRLINILTNRQKKKKTTIAKIIFLYKI